MKKIIIVSLVLLGSVSFASAATLDEVRACFGSTTADCISRCDLTGDGVVSLADMAKAKYLAGKTVIKTSAPVSTSGSKSGSRALSVSQMCERGLFDRAYCIETLTRQLQGLLAQLQALTVK